jgi:hypothetical protein|tara:strand:- start:941 stop:1210 length:270 start_codon:yes stop_codon:yes gene_type:complete
MADLNDYSKLTEEELDSKIQDVMQKLDIAYSMGQGPVVDQLVFHLDNLKMELGDRLEKQRFDIITHKTPEEYNITDDELKSSEESKDET